ncbi:hypothetical protein BASA50_001865 [Batrachochytrium salamandrivorans]|uniref:Septum formation protein Maf n=1 Tax=Batrachochytrium salamandrivorans TaxID=1357716 RepID=A0ABQ8FMX1_9FUNG|nr:hypothetical protein BASA62_000646 [Batrachochytrium salamandrivorans]KAH6601037.1 hypothetical protein BASA50_001865 [Batrachochytrium salamandrivorans]KAH9251765.1 septum formation protein Maf [Batrachochytrium salamandrivorans]KAH9264826.1 septum formation protein Maf [Batrachochytrium salamandrivorans]
MSLTKSQHTPSHTLPVILGSSSKFRAEVLKQYDILFTVQVANIDEKAIGTTHRINPDPDTLTQLVANAKMDALLAKLPAHTPASLLISCDQVVSYKGQIREKPKSHEECHMYLESYTHAPAETHSAVVVVNTGTGKRVQGVDVARQYFKHIPADVIQELICKGDVMHSSGGFVIEDPIIHPYLLRREGDEDSIIGMPIGLLFSLLAQAESNE